MGFDDPAAVPVLAAPVPILNHLDRCDIGGCDARAFVRALFEPLRDDQDTSALDMCGHHYRVAPMSLHERAYHIIDETHRILEG